MSMITEQVEELREEADFIIETLDKQYPTTIGVAKIMKRAADTIEQLAAKVRAENSESQPCEDAISRENTIEQIKIAQKKEYTFDYASLIDFIKVLPPVHSQPNKEDIYREREQAYMRGFEDGSRKYRTEQSEDAIRRQAAIIQLSHNKNGDDDCDVIVQKDIETIKALPPVNSQPKTGHWIYDEEYSDWDYSDYKCSCCKRVISIPYERRNEVYKEYPYCHCGAKMIEPQERSGEECR